jgi:hypothetical protein
MNSLESSKTLSERFLKREGSYTAAAQKSLVGPLKFDYEGKLPLVAARGRFFYLIALFSRSLWLPK